MVAAVELILVFLFGYLLPACRSDAGECLGDDGTCKTADADLERSACDDDHPNCAQWARVGECDANPGYMVVSCARSCATCHLRDPAKRCRATEPLQSAVGVGEINATFQRIRDVFKEYPITVLSTDPWLLTLDNFVSDEEASALLSGGDAVLQYEKSTDVNGIDARGHFIKKESSHRTSETAWCSVSRCFENSHVARVIARIENLTQVPSQNFEHIQLLRYQEHQQYKKHHDFIDAQRDLPCGPRVYTVFLYLNDVEDGGGTHFKNLGHTVTPKLGRAVIWPSVMDWNPFREDNRTSHAALPVKKGVKYGANVWVHQHDFKTWYEKGCTG